MSSSRAAFARCSSEASGVVGQAAGGVGERLDAAGEPRRLAELEHERAAGRAQRLVDAGQHPAQPGRAVRREQPDAVRVVARAERVERGLEGLGAQHRRLRLVELAEARVEPGLERVRLQQPVAEAVDGRDPGAVELARKVVPAAGVQLASGCASAARRRRASCT